MNTKRRLVATIALSLAASSCIAAGVTMGNVTAGAEVAIVNGWDVNRNVEGITYSSSYGTSTNLPMNPTDRGNGYTTMVTGNGYTLANNIALDVSKPIVMSYTTKAADASNQWNMFGLAPTFAQACSVTTGLQESGYRDEVPFFWGHKPNDSTSGFKKLGETVSWNTKLTARVENYCGDAYWVESGWAALSHGEVEIYLGETAAADGYVLINGMYVGYPTVTQASYPDGEAYFLYSAFTSSGIQIKLSNADAVTDVKDYNVMATGDNATVTFDTIDALRRADEGESVSFSVAPTEGYAVSSVSMNGTALTADENGKYTFTMPAGDATVTVVTEELPDTYQVTSSGNATVTLTAGTDVYTAGQTVNFTVEVKSYCTLHSVTVDGTVLTADADGNYSFTMPEKAVEIVVDAEKVYSTPSAEVIANSVNSWSTVTTTGGFGPVVDANGSSMVDEGKGYSNFVLNNGGAIASTAALDVTKPIYLDFLVQPNGPVPGGIPWHFIGLYDDWDIMVEADADAYGGSSIGSMNEKINAYKKLCFGFDYSDITIDSPCKLTQFGGVKINGTSGVTNKFGEAWGWSATQRGTNFDYAKFEIYIGETASEGYVKLDGVQIATPTVTQADFHEGRAYLDTFGFYSSRVQVKISQASELDVTTEVADNATVTFANGTDLTALKTYDEVSFQVAVPDGYGALVSVDGKEVKADENGNYVASVGWTKSTLKVEVNELVTASFEMNGGAAIDPITVTKGGTITAPEASRTGYTLAWYADAACTTAFDFSAAIDGDCTVYAKWTAVEYSIQYYDGAKKIRDLTPSSYTIETNNTALPKPAKEGYDFVGWYTDARFSGEKVETINAGMTGDLTLYAKYEVAKAEGCGSTIGGMSVALTAVVGAAFVLGRKRRK